MPERKTDFKNGKRRQPKMSIGRKDNETYSSQQAIMYSDEMITKLNFDDRIEDRRVVAPGDALLLLLAPGSGLVKGVSVFVDSLVRNKW